MDSFVIVARLNRKGFISGQARLDDLISFS